MATKKISFLCLLLTVFLWLTSCSERETQEIELPVFSSTIDQDKAIFKGLFMGIGDVARSIPSIDHRYVENIVSNLSKEERDFIETFIDDIYLDIKKYRNEEFNSFIKAIKSGDNSQISKGLVQFGNVYYSTLQNSPKYGRYFLKAKEKLDAINKADILDGAGNFDEDKFNSILVDRSTEVSDAEDDELIADEEMATTLGVAPVVCLTVIVWNYGVVVNAAAAVNAAIGVNVVVLCYIGVGDDCFSGGGDSEDRPTQRSSRLLEREMLINDISNILYEG
ncbi:hypothetical protein [Maribacter sp. 2-571]|uniref:hypothetical protein n=1 Tax=Maribacter sp. 2-571 TaxID=3417569 RepID=UPI003D33ED34